MTRGVRWRCRGGGLRRRRGRRRKRSPSIEVEVKRRKIRPPLFKFYRVSRLHPWLGSSSFKPPENREVECGHINCWPLLRLLRLSASWPAFFTPVALLEHKYEITMAVQVLCLALGVLFSILDIAKVEMS
ncbi:uncharacterized protein LOC127009750 [Eriocheir sinensis]|uniref:uncharacterized protein LOC127009750 n=1 Tax=Eriocheir sinensis TaxID=95602 RepID=UPI0021CABA1D|nr:uncharacterized protein LOC127009750 [Eriocheir sinensis]